MSLEEEKDHHFNELLTLIEKFSQLCILNKKKMPLAAKIDVEIQCLPSNQ